MSLLISALYAISAFASSEIKGIHSRPRCDYLLTGAASADLKLLKIDASLFNSAENSDERYLTALSHVLDLMRDESLLKRLSQSLIENQPVAEEAEVRDNEFYRDFPRPLTKRQLLTFGILMSQFVDVFDSYEIGLISAALPDLPVVADNLEQINSIFSSDRTKIAQALQKNTRTLLESEESRSALKQIFSLAANDPAFLSECQTVHLKMSNDVRSIQLFDLQSVSSTLERIGKGQLSRRDLAVLSGLTTNLTGRIALWGLKIEPSEPIKSVVIKGSRFDFYSHNVISKFTERYLAEVLGIKSDLATMSIALLSLSRNDPLPLPPRVLHSHVISASQSIIRALNQKYKPTLLPRRLDSPSPTSIPIFQLNLIDRFVPNNVSTKRRNSPAIKLPIVNNTTSEIVINTKGAEKDSLLNFTSFSKQSRPITQLESARRYQFWYLRDFEPKIRFVEFGPAVIEFFRNNPIDGRSILNALHLGYYRGQMSGIKPLSTKSKYFDGTVYEVKTYGKHRALLISVNNIWQMIKVTDKDDFHHDVASVRPL